MRRTPVILLVIILILLIITYFMSYRNNTLDKSTIENASRYHIDDLLNKG